MTPWVESLTCKIKQNYFIPLQSYLFFYALQLIISDVHFRYEDATTEESLPFAFGITIAKLSAQSTNESWVSFLGSLHFSGKLPIYPSPKLTSTLSSHLGQNVGLGEG